MGAKKIFRIILGVDIGNAYTKTSRGVRFLSYVSNRYGTSHIRNSYDVIIDGKEYKVGDEEGSSFTGPTKYEKDIYTATLCTAIIRSAQKKFLKDNPKKTLRDMPIDIRAKIGLGTPLEQFDDCKEECRQSALKIKNMPVELDGIQYALTVEDAIVEPQSAIISKENTCCIVYDFGGGTFDAGKWELIDGKFYKNGNVFTFNDLGFEALLTNFKTILTNKHKFRNVTTDDAVKLLLNKKFKRIGQGTIDISKDVDNILLDFVNRIKAELEKNNFDLMADKLYLIGGCAALLKPYVMEANGIDQEDIIVEKNPQFSNALAYERAAKVTFEGFDTKDDSEE
ncbi:stbA family protein (plasmid) [Clostridium baratii str. Sullivan]|uniref:StbA family protein n=1 Tax=Clostridium baratii str. Sullivan TaxID=1415775 RepID=A0A0A7G0E6_9CLOT|nr:ParM/StbA family protein [Clostridium baratii]AIY85308.1 stbA family protein [Clostridium baratii str. Sullivan]